eukprot:4007223-Alexandrium_andersonii.AAC.1
MCIRDRDWCRFEGRAASWVRKRMRAAGAKAIERIGFVRTPLLLELRPQPRLNCQCPHRRSPTKASESRSAAPHPRLRPPRQAAWPPSHAPSGAQAGDCAPASGFSAFCFGGAI